MAMVQRVSIILRGNSVETGAGRAWGNGATRTRRADNGEKSMPSDVERLLDMLLKPSGRIWSIEYMLWGT